ncbi:MAG: hypothetical protein ACOY5R_06500 [Pseudomonadota bacterium]
MTLGRSLPLRPAYDPSAIDQERILALEEWKAEAEVLIADLVARVEALENP